MTKTNTNWIPKCIIGILLSSSFLILRSQADSKFGNSIPITGEIKVMLIWAEVANSFTQNSAVPGYGEGTLPPDTHTYFDASYSPWIP